MLNQILKNEDFNLESFRAYLKEKVPRVHLSEIRKSEVEHSCNALLEEASHFSKGKRLEELNPFRGLVEGVFDMTHFGHFNAFRQASKLCDDLVVGVNGTEEVTKAKGLAHECKTAVR